jgi:hypothetical protein
MNRVIKKISAFMLIGVMVLNILSYQVYALENTVDISKTIVDAVDGDGRTYEVTYNVDVDINETGASSDVVLILDRSGSMLSYAPEEVFVGYDWVYRIKAGELDDYVLCDGYEFTSYYSSGQTYYYGYVEVYETQYTERIADQVKEAMIEFINQVMSVSGNRVAIVAYAQTATQINNGNYYTDAASAISAVENLLSYRTSYNGINWSNYYYDEDRDYIGSMTNIQAGFEEAQDIIENTESTNEQKHVVLFTDGNANEGEYTVTTEYEVEEEVTTYTDEVIGTQTIDLGTRISDYEWYLYGSDIYYEVVYYTTRWGHTENYRNYYVDVVQYASVTEMVTNTYTETETYRYAEAAIYQAAELKAIEGVSVYTLGYTGGLSDSEAATSEENLQLMASTTADCYISPTGDELDQLLEGISSSINSIGTNTIVKDMLADGFLIDPTSINASVGTTSLNSDNTELTWNIGDLGAGMHTLTMTIYVADDVYPTGRKDVPTSDSCELSYNDLNGDYQGETFNATTVDIASLDSAPTVDLVIEHLNSTNGEYLVGDTALIQHTFTYTNPDGYDYVQIDINDFEKELLTGSAILTDAMTLIGDESWSVSGQAFVASFDESAVDDNPDDEEVLSWSSVSLLNMLINAPGEYEFAQTMDYVLTNPYGLYDEYVYDGFAPDIIKVKEGLITISLTDSVGNSIEGATIYINDVPQVNTSTQSGIYTLENVATGDGTTATEITTGDYVIEVAYPSGYAVPDGSGYTINDENNIELTTTINYTNNEFVEDIVLNKLTIEDIAVTTIDGASSIEVDYPTTSFSAIVKFNTLSDMSQVALNLADNYASDDITFTLSRVENSTGNNISGFSKSGTEIVYSDASTDLPLGEYSAYIEITIPNSISTGDSFDVTVDEVEIEGVSAVTSCDELSVTYIVLSTDTTISIDLTSTPLDLTHYKIDVEITSDQTDIVAYMCLPGNKGIADFTSIADSSVGYGLSNIDDTDLQDITAQFNVYYDGTSENQSNGIYTSSGIYTVYAKNAAGNETVQTIVVSEAIDAEFDLF